MSVTSSASAYDIILNKISSMRSTYQILRDKSDSVVFSALCVKCIFYKNPSLTLRDDDILSLLVDGPYDGGVDVLLTDPNSEESDLVLGQSKFYESAMSEQDIIDALLKMAFFYKDMRSGHYEQVNQTVQRRFLSLCSEMSEDSKVHFVLYTSAPKNRIRVERVKSKFLNQICEYCPNSDVDIYFGNDIVEEIKELESRRPSVEYGKLRIDHPDNYLSFGGDAVIVNVSAYSLKQLYAQHSTNLLARNLRYHVAGRSIDKGINNTISDAPDEFWYRNNGITIVCDSFELDGKEVKLTNFSIVNGGQTTWLLYRNRNINEESDLFVQCKIIQAIGSSEEEKSYFCLEIAKAVNSQKPIKPVDLKANAPEQVMFAQALREQGVFYLTKRGEEIPRQYKEAYLNTNLASVGKLCFCGIFQTPCQSRNKPSNMYEERYYGPIFDTDDQSSIAYIVKELLYIDYFFRNDFIKKFDSLNENEPDSGDRISFAHNARTICIAFAAFAARYKQGNISEEDISLLINARTGNIEANDALYKRMRQISEIKHLFTPELFNNKPQFEDVLSQLFNAIIDVGVRTFSYEKMHTPTLIATNFLKKEANYYLIISSNWRDLRSKIKEILG